MNTAQILRSRPIRGLGVLATSGAILAGALTLATNGAASAQTVPIHIAGTGGDGLRLRAGTNTSSATLTTIPEGAAPAIQCATSGQSVNGISVWMRASWNGQTGYFSSAYDDSHYANWQDLHNRYGIDQCGAAAPAPAPAPVPPTTGVTAVQQSAMNWARARVGSSAYNYLCLSFVFDAYSQAGRNLRSQLTVSVNNNTYPVDIWGKFNSGRTGTGTPPAGALVFYSSRNGDRTLSHVTLSVGGGNTVSTHDNLGTAIHYETVAQHAYANYLGWWLPAS